MPGPGRCLPSCSRTSRAVISQSPPLRTAPRTACTTSERLAEVAEAALTLVMTLHDIDPGPADGGHIQPIANEPNLEISQLIGPMPISSPTHRRDQWVSRGESDS